MKKKVLMIFAIILFDAFLEPAWAYDGSVALPNGNTIYYIYNGTIQTITVCSPTASYPYWHGYTKPTGLLEIPDSITHNGSTYCVTAIANGAFYDCDGLTTVIIPDGVTAIGASAFYHCTSMTSVTIGSNIPSITNYAFHDCTGLVEIISKATIAPTFGDYTFDGVSSTIAIHIPCGSLMSYYSRWSYFSNFIEASGFSFSATSYNTTMGYVNILTPPTCQSPIAVLNASANEGYQFNHWSDGNTDNPRTLTLTTDSSIVGYFTLQTNDTVYYYDTTYISVHDTTLVHDTIYFPYYVHDTTTVYDILYDTVHDTIIAYVNVPVHDTVFAYIEVPVHDTVYLPQYIYDTIWLHDTITIHDTIYITSEGIDGMDDLNAKVYSCNGQIVVDGASGNTVTLYDASGRVLAIKHDNYTSLRFDAPVSGTYMIKIGAYPARKVVVIR